MNKFMMLLIMLPLLLCSTVGAAETADNEKECRQCGMDLGTSAQTRMLISYVDGTESKLCSHRCAVAEMDHSKGKQMNSLLVADYPTGELIAAGTASWIVGGRREGGMNSPARWAFARKEEAETFRRENGGEQSTFDRVLLIAGEGSAEESGAGHAHQHGKGAQMQLNAAFSDDIYHAHPAGSWMANYKFMQMTQRGLRNGSTDVPVENATPVGNQPFGYMMAPTSMTMDMHMVMVMYGLSDRLTLMGTGSYLVNKMEMVMNMGMGMGMGNQPDHPMETSGIGDTELRGIYRINENLTGSLGIGIPTGDIDQEVTAMGTRYLAPYDMQLGSGTFDLKPALTYNALSDDALWNWGGQAAYTYRLGRNGNGYSLGDNVKLTGWLQRAFGPAATWLRLAYNYTARIDGSDPEIDKLLDPALGAPTPDADPRNYGGHRLDAFAGVSWAAGPFSVGVEAGIPLYQYLNGLQLKNDWSFTAGVQKLF